MTADDRAIVVGVQTYPHLSDLGSPENDALAVRDWLVDPTGGDVPPANLQLIVSSQFTTTRLEPKLDAVRDAMDALVNQAEESRRAHSGLRLGRRLYLYFSGHGIAAADRRAALLMANASPLSLGHHLVGRPYAEWFVNAGLFDEVLLLMDCCQEPYPRVAPNPVHYVDRVSPGWDQRKLFVGCGALWRRSAREKVIDGTPRGVFTIALLEGLRGGARDPSSGSVTSRSLEEYLYRRMPELLSAEERSDADISQEPEIDYRPKSAPFVLWSDGPGPERRGEPGPEPQRPPPPGTPGFSPPEPPRSGFPAPLPRPSERYPSSFDDDPSLQPFTLSEARRPAPRGVDFLGADPIPDSFEALADYFGEPTALRSKPLTELEAALLAHALPPDRGLPIWARATVRIGQLALLTSSSEAATAVEPEIARHLAEAGLAPPSDIEDAAADLRWRLGLQPWPDRLYDRPNRLDFRGLQGHYHRLAERADYADHLGLETLARALRSGALFWQQWLLDQRAGRVGTELARREGSWPRLLAAYRELLRRPSEELGQRILKVADALPPASANYVIARVYSALDRPDRAEQHYLLAVMCRPLHEPYVVRLAYAQAQRGGAAGVETLRAARRVLGSSARLLVHTANLALRRWLEGGGAGPPPLADATAALHAMQAEAPDLTPGERSLALTIAALCDRAEQGAASVPQLVAEAPATASGEDALPPEPEDEDNPDP